MLENPRAPAVERLQDGRPLLRRVGDHPWENKVVFNPAVAYVEDLPMLERVRHALPGDASARSVLQLQTALTFFLYRAQGEPTPSYDHRRSALGLAVLTPELELLARHTEPLLVPDQEYENLGVEDPRITRIGDRFFMLYCGYASGKGKNRIRIAMASSNDLVHWEKHGLITGDFNEIDNKNAMLFPVRIGGKFILLHRPMEGADAMCIHWAEADDLLGKWTSRGVLMKPLPNPEFKDVWIGGGAPPLLLPGGRFLILYHIGNRRHNGDREYDLGIALGDPADRGFVIKRHEPFLRPHTSAETRGDEDLGVNNVVFTCGAYFHKGDLFIPYAGADSVILGARINKEELDRYVRA